MALIAPAYEVVQPSYFMPEIIMPNSQASGAFDLLPTGEPLVRLGEGDLAVYMRRLDVRTKVAAGQSSYNALPSADVIASQISTATYLLRSQAIYDHHDTAAAGRNGFSLTEAYRLANQQGFAQLGRTGLLYGFNPANGEGIVNAAGITTLNLPPDSFGNDTVVTYDNGQMALFLMGQVLAIKTRTNQLGIGRQFTILGPQRTLGTFEYNVVQLVQFQRPGAGTSSTAEMLKSVLMNNGDELIWAYDDTLEGRGAGGSDLVIIQMPKIERPQGGTWNTNKFAELEPGQEAMDLQLCDMAAPREITVPLALGAVDTLFELRMTSGWAFRPEGTTAISMVYQ